MAATPAKAISFRIQIVVEEDGDGYHAYCPALKGLHTDGDTPEEALEAALEGASWFLESMIRHGDPIPLMCREQSVAADAGPKQRFDRDVSVLVGTEV